MISNLKIVYKSIILHYKNKLDFNISGFLLIIFLPFLFVMIIGLL